VGARTILTRDAGWHVYTLVGLPRDAPTEWIPCDTAWRESTGLGMEYPREKTVKRLDFILDVRAGRI